MGAKRLDSPASPKSKRRLDYTRAEGLIHKLGIGGARSCAFYTVRNLSDPFGFFRRRSWSPSWQTVPRGPEGWEVAVALVDSITKVAPAGLDEVRVLLWDVDVHEEWVPPRAEPLPDGVVGIDEWLALPRRPSRRAVLAGKKRHRAWMAGIAGPVVEALRELVPIAVVTSTPRGYRICTLLREPVSATVAAALAEAVRMRLPEGLCRRVEAFPRVDAEGRGRLCSLPFLGPNRAVKGDLVTPDGMKKNAIDAFLLEDGIDAEELARELEIDRGRIDLSGHLRDELPITSDRYSAEPAPGQLRMGDFAERVRSLLGDGIGAGESREAVQRITWAMVALGYRDDRVLAAWERIVEDPKHSANHLRTKAGRRSVLAQVRAQLRYLAGLEARMTSRQIRALVDDLLAPEGTPIQKEKTPCSTTKPRTTAKKTSRTKTSTARSQSPSNGSRRALKTSPSTSASSERSSPPAGTSSSAARPTSAKPSGSSRRVVPTAPSRGSRSSCWPDDAGARHRGGRVAGQSGQVMILERATAPPASPGF